MERYAIKKLEELYTFDSQTSFCPKSEVSPPIRSQFVFLLVQLFISFLSPLLNLSLAYSLSLSLSLTLAFSHTHTVFASHLHNIRKSMPELSAKSLACKNSIT